MAINTEFARLFKKYRLRSEIETLREFSDLMAAEGIVYDNTIYTRWQKGERTPRDRKVLLKMLEVFLKKGGIYRIEDCNKLLESANARDLSDFEINKAKTYLTSKSTVLIANIENFVERRKILRDACWALLKKTKVLLYGIPGVGKTAISIYISHLLAEHYSDGVYWISAEQRPLSVLLDEILSTIQKVYYCDISINDKLNKISEVLRNNSMLVLVDNIDFNRVDYKLLDSLEGSIIFTSVSLCKSSRTLSIKVPIFSAHEYRRLAVNILGKPYFDAYNGKIMHVGSKLGWLPITTHIYLQQIASDSKNLSLFLEQIEAQKINYDKIKYDKKNLEQSFEVIIKQLSRRANYLLHACSVFMGDSFSLSKLQEVVSMSDSSMLKHISYLRKYSLINKATYNRHRLHPALRDYLINNTEDFDLLTDKLLMSYEENIHLITKESKLSSYIELEYSNIESLRSYYYRNKQYNKSLRCWDILRNYLFTSGKWNNLLYISKQVEHAYRSTNNMAGLARLFIEDLGKIYYFLDQDNERTLACANKGIQIAKEMGDHTLLSVGKQKLSILLIEQSKLERAVKLLMQSNKYFQQEKMYYDLMFGYIYLGHIYKKLGNYSKSIEYFQYVIGSKNSSKEVQALAYTCVSTVHALIGNISLAEAGLRSALSICTKLNLQLTKALTYMCIGKVQTNKNNNTQAHSSFEKANKIFSMLNVKPRSNSIWIDLIQM